MTVKQTDITLKQGVRVRLLLTPALYGVGKARGIDLTTVMRDASDSTGMIRSYAKLAYCAAINQWEVEAVDNPDKGAFPYTFADFDGWSWEQQDEVREFINAVLLAFTGKGLKDYAKEGDSTALKKKTGK